MLSDIKLGIIVPSVFVPLPQTYMPHQELVNLFSSFFLV